MKKTITIHFAEGEKSLTIGFVPAKSTWVDCKKQLECYPTGFLVERNHKFLQTQFILNDIVSCNLIVFNEKMEFVSVKTFNSNGDAPFSFLIPDHYVIVVPAKQRLKKSTIRSFQINK